MKVLLGKPSAGTPLIGRALMAWVLLLPLAIGAIPVEGRAATTPSDVYAAFELAERTMDRILEAEGLPPFRRALLPEKGLKPMHVYQVTISCVEALHTYELEKRIIPVPIVIANPRRYSPSDVLRLAELVLFEVRRIARALGVAELPEERKIFTGKTPTDVYFRIATIYMKLSLLSGREKISPNEVYAQMVRAISDVKSILGRIDPARRYRIDAPKSAAGLKPADVFRECLSARESINASRRHFGLGTIPVPAVADGHSIEPMDVFLQTQVIIAEINILKLGTGTISITPLPVPVTGKTPSDVHQQAATMKYLLGQIGGLEKLVEEMKSK